MEHVEYNPLLADFDAPREAPPFDKIRTEHYEPAFEAAIHAARQEVGRVAASAAPPTFENTIVALERSGERLERVASIFFNLNAALTGERMQEIARRVSPALATFRHEVHANQALFARVKRVRDDTPPLNDGQRALLEKTWRGFVNGGAGLDEAGRERFKEIAIELSRLSLDFDSKVLADTNAFTLHVTDEAGLAGLPAGAREAAAMEAARRALPGWIFTLHAPSYVPFMKYADDRAAREKMYRAHASRGFRENENNTVEVVKRVVALRLELARLMGHENYAAYALSDRMARDPATVNRFLAALHAPYRAAADREAAAVFAHAARDGAGDARPWDWSYHANKLRRELYDLDDEMLRPYFQLERVQAGIFDLARRLYGITFREAPAIPRYHEEASCFEVFDADGSFLSLLYLDYFPRESKEGGAWMTNFREQAGAARPQVSLVMNFTRPTATLPSLLALDEVNTFLHEFGHALHGMLSRCEYASISGTNVYRDFVELPSQIMENWLLEKEWLDTWAVHHETGEHLPGELVEKIRRASRFLSGYAGNRQLSFGMLDMAWHSVTRPVDEPLPDFEARALAPTGLFPPVEGTAVSTAFTHVFSGGYAAGYYGYKWAEVLDADAFSLFKCAGIFDRATAAAFREHVLERGASAHPMTLYKRFRGAEPTIDALLEREGLAGINE
ncbi:MAG: M3 family metallopeptidase [Odoribacteraceae bacterium]|jgi:peptidyl-dipeptidase Dcp|nr:M3 family metallopeptidase [Odoribacteraceae bacterium]